MADGRSAVRALSWREVEEIAAFYVVQFSGSGSVRFSAMKRRDLLKALPAIATTSLNGRQAAAFFNLPADHKVIAFVNADVIPTEIFAKLKFPEGIDLTVCPVRIPKGQTIDDFIRVYEIEPH
jgi:sulfur carrier protein ThiS